MGDVVFYEVFGEEESALRQFLPPDIRAQFIPETIQQQKKPRPAADFISIRTQSRIPVSWAPKLKGILTRSQGYDHLVSFRRDCERDVPCGYLGSYCARAVAEHAVWAAMALLRKTKKQIRDFSAFSRDGLTGFECRGRRALIVGVGEIGAQIADITRGLRMDVRGVDIAHKHSDLEYVALNEGLRWAEIVFCACSLTQESAGMLNYAALKQAKPGMIFVNVSRGEISPAEDLEALLAEGVLGGLSLDVYDEESVLADYLRAGSGSITPKIQAVLNLKDRDDVLFTPHNAFNTRESLEAKSRLSAQAVVCFLTKGVFPCPVPADEILR